MTVRGADELIKAYNKRFARISGFMDECVQKARADGYVETITGRRRPVFDISSAVFAQRSAAERVAINSVVQGSAADLIKIAMIRIHHRIEQEKLPCDMLLQVHDELVFEVAPDHLEAATKLVKHEMEGAYELKVPLLVDIGVGPNWRDAK